MRRFAFLLALAFLSIVPIARSDDLIDKSIFVVTDYGATPGDLTGQSVDNAIDTIRAQIQKRDAASGLARRYLGATIKFPASLRPWVVGRPHFIDGDRWEIAGDGRENTKVVSRQSYYHPAFIFGYPRGDPFPPDLHPDAFGVLDTSAAAKPGQRWGVKTTSAYGISLPTSPFSSGPGDGRRYQGLRQHLAEVLIVPNDSASVLPAGDLLGFDGWRLSAGGNGKNSLRFSFRVDVGGIPSDPQQFDLTIGSILPSYRLAIQVDHDLGKITAFCNGVQLAVNPIAGKSDLFGSGKFTSYAGNDLYPFNLGSTSSVIDAQGSGTTITPTPMTVYGLRLASGLAYKDGGPGSTQQRLDGKPITDFSRYFDPASGTFGLLTLTDPPSDSPSSHSGGRFISWDAPCKPYIATVRGMGLFVTWKKNTIPWVTGNTLRNITVSTAGDPNSYGACAFGQAVAVGVVREFRVSNVEATGGAHGLGSWNVGPSWTTRLEDCRLIGTDAGLYLYQHLVSANDLNIPRPMRTGLRLFGTGGHWQGLMFGDSGQVLEANIYCHGGEYGGNYRFDDVIADTEAGGRAKIGVLVMECHPFTPCRLKVSNLDAAMIDPNAALVVLRDSPRSKDTTTPLATIDGISASSNQHRAMVLRQSGKWGVSVSGSMLFGNAGRNGMTVPNIFDTFSGVTTP